MRVRGLRVAYDGAEALHGVDLTVGAGEVVALLGANGAGKSTLLRAVSGLVASSGGTIHVGGTRADGLETHEVVRLGVGHVPEGRRVFGQLDVRENLLLGGYQRRDDLADDVSRVLTLLPALAGREAQPAGTLSGGEQQMLAIGRALMGRPTLLLLDEPTTGLAPLVVEQVLDILDQVNAAGTAMLLVEQDVRVALRCARRAYVLETGTVTRSGDVAGLRDDDRLLSAYLGEGEVTSG